MGSSDPDRAPDCVEHVWRLDGVTMAEGSFSEYTCVRCGAEVLIGPGQAPPQTV